ERRAPNRIAEPGLLKQPLQTSEPVHRERTLGRVVAARVKKDDDRGTAVEGVCERQLRSRVILKSQTGDIGDRLRSNWLRRRLTTARTNSEVAIIGADRVN